MATETARTSGDDPVLAAGLSALESEGVNLSDPVTDAPVDTTDESGALPGAAPAVETPAASESTTVPETAVTDPASPETPNPLDGTEPFTYSVNGETRTMPHAYRVPGEGILIEEQAVPQFQLMASRSESLDKTNRELYEQTQRFEQLTAWTTRDQNGQSQILTGPAAIEAAQMHAVRTEVALNAVLDVLKDPAQLLGLLLPDGQGGATINEQALQTLVMRSELNELKAVQQVQQRFQGLAKQPIIPPSIDVQASAPAIVSHYATQLKATGLTAEDRTFLGSILPRFVRQAEQADVQANPSLRLGQQVVDQSFEQQITHLQSLRANTTTVAKTAGDAAKFNAGQKAGTKQVSVAKPVTPSVPTPAVPKSKTAVWDDILQSAMAEIG